MKGTKVYLMCLILLGQITIVPIVMIHPNLLSMYFAQLCCICLLVLWIFLVIDNKFDMLSPSVWLALWFVIYTIIVPLANCLLDYTFYASGKDYIPAAVLLVVHGLSAFLLGYYILPQKWSAIPASFGSFLVRRNKLNTSLLVLSFLYFGILIYLIFGENDATSISDQVWRGWLIPLLCVAWALMFCEGKKKRIVQLSIFFMLLVPAYMMLVGSREVIYTKEGLFQLFVFPIIAGYILTGQASWKTMFFWLMIFFLLMN